MDNPLPQSTNLSPTPNTKKPYLILLLLIITATIASVIILVYLKNPNLLQKFSKSNPTSLSAPGKNLTVPFDPDKNYVNSTVIYQQLTGIVVSFDQQTSVLTLKNGQDTFSLKIPLGNQPSPTQVGFTDLSGLSRFKTGDEVIIGGSANPPGEFKISKFVISQKAAEK